MDFWIEGQTVRLKEFLRNFEPERNVKCACHRQLDTIENRITKD